MSDSLLNGALSANRPTPQSPQLFSASSAPAASGTTGDASFSRTLERRMDGAAKPANGGESRSSAPQRAERQPSARERAQEAQESRPERADGDRGARGERAPAATDEAAKATAEATDEDPAADDQETSADPAASLAAFLPQVAATAADLAGEAPADEAALEDVLSEGGGRGKSALAALGGGATAEEALLETDAATTDAAHKSGAAVLQKLLGEAAGRAQATARPDAAADPATGAAAKAWKTEPLQTSLAALAAARPAGSGTDTAVSAAHQPDPVAQMPAFAPELRAEAAKPTQMPVATPVGQRAWAEDVGSKVMWLAGRGESKAELVLTPPSLGKLEVSINLNGDQSTAHFVAASTAARDALEQAMPRLRELLQQAGINLGEASVSTSGDHPAGQEAPRRGSAGLRAGEGEGAEPSALTTASAAAGWTRLSNGLVDTFA